MCRDAVCVRLCLPVSPHVSPHLSVSLSVSPRIPVSLCVSQAQWRVGPKASGYIDMCKHMSMHMYVRIHILCIITHTHRRQTRFLSSSHLRFQHISSTARANLFCMLCLFCLCPPHCLDQLQLSGSIVQYNCPDQLQLAVLSAKLYACTDCMRI